MKKKTIFISIFVILSVILYLYYSNTFKQRITHIQCPESYSENNTSTTEYRDALTNWTLEFFKARPNASVSDWAEAKSRLWEKNNCVIALERSKLSGRVTDLKPWEQVDYSVQTAIQEAMDKSIK